MAESASSSASSAIQFGNNGDGASLNSPVVIAAAILGSLLLLGFLVFTLTHRK